MLREAVTKKRIISAFAFALSFASLYTILTMSGFHSWFREIVLYGGYENYDMVDNMHNAYPRMGFRTDWFSPEQIISMLTVSTSISMYVVAVINRDWMSLENNHFFLIGLVMLASYVVSMIAVAAQPPCMGLDSVLSLYLPVELVDTVNVGPTQLSAISCVMSITGIGLVYWWSRE